MGGISTTFQTEPHVDRGMTAFVRRCLPCLEGNMRLQNLMRGNLDEAEFTTPGYSKEPHYIAALMHLMR